MDTREERRADQEDLSSSKNCSGSCRCNFSSSFQFFLSVSFTSFPFKCALKIAQLCFFFLSLDHKQNDHHSSSSASKRPHHQVEAGDRRLGAAAAGHPSPRTAALHSPSGALPAGTSFSMSTTPCEKLHKGNVGFVDDDNNHDHHNNNHNNNNRNSNNNNFHNDSSSATATANLHL